MRSEKEKRTLICYAGSASEASIGSKPLGSELGMFICLLLAKSQYFVDRLRSRCPSCEALNNEQYTDNIEETIAPPRLVKGVH